MGRQPPGPIDQDAASELIRLVWQPLRKHLGNATIVLIAPDGALCGLPFAALPGSKPGSFLIEEVAIGYVTSGRHLLELAADTDRPASSGLLAVGNLDYGKLPEPATGPGKLPWKRLPGTRLEVEQITQSFRKAFPEATAPTLLTGETAGAARLKRELTPDPNDKKAQRWRYLHLASHGFFEPPQKEPPRARRPVNDFPSFGEERSLRTYGRNPLLLSGLVLSGANRSAEEGILTAEEVASLDLGGLELAVLSACETGLGKVAGGEGVLGLQRAFQAAGARTLVTSLWNVNDAATAILMEQFYANLWNKDKPLSKLEALRQAQLYVLRHPEKVKQLMVKRGLAKEAEDLPDGGKIEPRKTATSHPALWAAFVLSGDAQ